MQFTYDINCGDSILEISEDTYKYLINYPHLDVMLLFFYCNDNFEFH